MPQRNPLVFQIISGIEEIWMRGWGECQDIPSKITRLTVPKKAVWEPFSLSAFSSIEKFYSSDAYVTIFRRKFFV